MTTKRTLRGKASTQKNVIPIFRALAPRSNTAPRADVVGAPAPGEQRADVVGAPTPVLGGPSPGASCDDAGVPGIIGFDGTTCVTAVGAPCPTPSNQLGWISAGGGACVQTAGTPCTNDAGSTGVAAQLPGGANMICAITSPKKGEGCALPGGKWAGVFHDPYCIDEGMVSSPIYDQCLKTTVYFPDGNDTTPVAQLLHPDDCLVVASSYAYLSNAKGQAVGNVVTSSDLCASLAAIEVDMGGEILKICADKAWPQQPPPPPQQKDGDPCEAGPAGPPNSVLPGLHGTIQSGKCVAVSGQKCQDQSGVPGTIDSTGTCTHLAQIGDACQPDGTHPEIIGVIGPDGLCVAKAGTPCLDGTATGAIDANGHCIAKAGQPCDSGEGPKSGTTSGTGQCLANPTPGKCTDPAFPHWSISAKTCVTCTPASGSHWDDAKQDCVCPEGMHSDEALGKCVPHTQAPTEPRESSSVLPWMLALGILGAGAYYYTTKKK